MRRPFKRTNKVFYSWTCDKTRFETVILGVIDDFIVIMILLRGLFLRLPFRPETMTLT